MACGSPVVASDIPGNGEVVQARAAGLIAPASTPEGIAAAVCDLWAAMPSRLARGLVRSGSAVRRRAGDRSGFSGL